ncbi:MAG: DUF4019 domain-containing protein [Longimonas sp.]|uniref:DUF4019 domain-containing protein n=1 Tax=Longimonas sp. TaxID=2039626 RepID=UPI00334CBB9F
MNTLSRIAGIFLLGTALVWGAPLAQAQDMPAPSPENPEAVEEAREAAESWLELTDAGSFAESWDAAAELLQSEVTRDEWTQQSEQAEQQIGSVEEREFMGGQYQDDIPNVPEGEYVIMQYESSFSGIDQGVMEIVVATMEEGQWKVAGYTVQPAQQPQQPQQPQPQPPQPDQPPNN